MNKNNTIRFVLILSLLISCLDFSYSQDIIINNQNELGAIKETKEITFDYKDTPDYVFIDRINFMKNFTELQFEILDTYNYPKFISSNDKNQIELDIKLHWEDVARWEEENEESIDEILDALGIRR